MPSEPTRTNIEIGLGGTLLQMIRQQSAEAAKGDLEVYWVVFSAPGPRSDEALASAGKFLDGVSRKRIRVGSFRESYFPSDWSAIKDWFEEIRINFEPDVIFTHYRDDRHQDHRVLSDLIWNSSATI